MNMPKRPKATGFTAMRLMSILKKKKTVKPSVLILYAVVSLFALGILFLGIIYLVYLRTLPSIDSIETLALPESSVIRDRNGNELYSIFAGADGKRTYVSFLQISENIRDAVVSTEDKTFFENQGVDVKGLVRSVLNYVTGKTDRIQGTSTISQQLIKVSFLTNERSLPRKIKEGYLSFRLNSEYSKEKILELYLNRISFGNNASGIEEAAKTYFGKPANEVGVLGATILASLPKGPTYYSPYTYRDRLMGYLYVFKDGKTDEKITLGSIERRKEFRVLVEEFKKMINQLTFERINSEDVKICGLKQEFLKQKYSIDSNGCSRLTYKDVLTLLNDIRIQSSSLGVAASAPATASGATTRGATASGTTARGTTATAATTTAPRSLEGYAMEYNTGRKDFVASRMLEDDKITAEEFKGVIINGIDFEFKKNVTSIKYPHFVMYVQDYLIKKYGDDFFDQGGLQVYTTIDPKLQDKAEALVKQQVKTNRDKYGATSAALVSIDNKSGQIVSMVGGPDYYNTEEQGQVNVVTSLRQPGSSFKPIVYSLAMAKDAVGPETPVYDVNTKFGSWDPDNYDQKFMGRMKLRTALDYSRNIPAIKMFKVAGGEEEVVKHARSLGIESLRNDGKYGMPLAIGTGEIRPLELAQAYSVFAQNGWRKEPEPILKIVDKKGNVIVQYVESSGKYVFSDAASYLLSNILSDASARPSAFWNNVLTLKDRPVAAKTGTSNKDVSTKGVKKILPRDLWTAGYTPQYTTVVWAGNVDGTETKGNCDGLNCAAPIWRDFMEFAHKGLPVMEFKKPEGIYTATISSVTGKLASDSTPPGNRVTGMFAVKPTKYESAGKEVTVDALCNGKVTDDTPAEAVKTGVLIDLEPIVESYDSTWVSATRNWANSKSLGDSGDIGDGYITSYSEQVCVRPSSDRATIDIQTNLVDGSARPLGKSSLSVNYQSANPIQRIRFLMDGKQIKTINFDTPVNAGEAKADYTFTSNGTHEIKAVVIDIYGFSATQSAQINFGGAANPPSITINSPKSGEVSLYEGQVANLRFTVTDPVELSAVNLYIGGELYKILGASNDEYVVPVGDGLEVGMHDVEIRATSITRDKASKVVKVEILQK